jgi:hypothetical protein
MNLRIYVCMYVCMYVCTNMCVRVRVCACERVYASVGVCLCVRVRACVCVCRQVIVSNRRGRFATCFKLDLILRNGTSYTINGEEFRIYE